MRERPRSSEAAEYEEFYATPRPYTEERRTGYDRDMDALRLRYVTSLGAGRRVVELGCGTGLYLFPLTAFARTAIGIDFVSRPLEVVRDRAAARGIGNISLVRADIRALPLATASSDVTFSYGTLYAVANVEHAIREAARVTVPGGRVILELGNVRSLNTLVVRSSSISAYHLAIGRMRECIAAAGLRIDEHRRFQILPMYGGPWYLRPFVSSWWKRPMSVRMAGRSLDERISSLPALRGLAFRHLFVCTRVP